MLSWASPIWHAGEDQSLQYVMLENPHFVLWERSYWRNTNLEGNNVRDMNCIREKTSSAEHGSYLCCTKNMLQDPMQLGIKVKVTPCDTPGWRSVMDFIGKKLVMQAGNHDWDKRSTYTWIVSKSLRDFGQISIETATHSYPCQIWILSFYPGRVLWINTYLSCVRDWCTDLTFAKQGNTLSPQQNSQGLPVNIRTIKCLDKGQWTWSNHLISLR